MPDTPFRFGPLLLGTVSGVVHTVPGDVDYSILKFLNWSNLAIDTVDVFLSIGPEVDGSRLTASIRIPARTKWSEPTWIPLFPGEQIFARATTANVVTLTGALVENRP